MVEATTRLHITPLTPDLLSAVVGPALLPKVANVSYHQVHTFPENNYGYLDLPPMEADKLKRKINGAILKGKKIKVEEARPKKRKRGDETVPDQPAEEPTIASTAQKPKKSKKERNVVKGLELPSDRKVKRGWTEAETKSPKQSKSKSKSKPTTSKYTDKDEVVFRTKLPPNKNRLDKSAKDKGKSKKGGDEHVVHEFEKSTKQPSFLREDALAGRQNLSYVEGRGWVDDDDNVVEAESARAVRQREGKANTSSGKLRSTKKQNPPSSTSPSSSESDEEAPPRDTVEDDTSSSGSSSASDSDSDSDSDSGTDESPRPNTLRDASTASVPEVHPLEALFKKPSKPGAGSQDIAKPSLEISTSFSFFGAEDGDDLEDEPKVPETPFTSQDFRSRGIRSAAPTPDTAHPSRFNSYGSTGLPGDEDLDDHDSPSEQLRNEMRLISSQAANKNETPSRKQSDFEKKFWENRAENDRAWKLRRRAVLKEKRQRENKARRPKNW